MNQKAKLNPLILNQNEGRSYSMGRMSAVFKADLAETDSTLSVSEWSLDANTAGPHIHKHPEAHLFYIIEGCLAVYLQGKDWVDAKKETYIYIPGGIEHGFENRSDEPVRFMSINTPGGFEQMVPSIVNYFDENPLGDAQNNIVKD